MRKAIEFSTKELKIIQLICKQYSSQETAEKLGLSSRTVEGIRGDILAKMKVKNVAGLVVFAVKHHLYKIR